MSDQPQIPIEWQINRLMHVAAPLPRLVASDLGEAEDARAAARARLVEMVGSDPAWAAALTRNARDLVGQVVGWRGRSHSCLRDRAQEVLFLMDVAREAGGVAPRAARRIESDEARVQLAQMDASDPAWRGALLRVCQDAAEAGITGQAPFDEARDQVERLLKTALETDPPALRNGFRLPGDPPHTPVAPGHQMAADAG